MPVFGHKLGTDVHFRDRFENCEIHSKKLLLGMIANTPSPPYFAVIFTSIKRPDDIGYSDMAKLMEELVVKQPGYLGHESARDGLGITISYWETLEAIVAWKALSDHKTAQKLGKENWYSYYAVRICRVEKAYVFP